LILAIYISDVNDHSSNFNGYGIINAIISLVIIAVKIFKNSETFNIRLVKTYWIHILSLIYHSYNVLVIINIIKNIIFMPNTVYYRLLFFVALLANITIAFSEFIVLSMSGKDE
jgi:hypothetical protein